MSKELKFDLTDIKKEISKNELGKAIELLHEYNDHHGNNDLYNLIVIQSGRLEQNKRESWLNTVDYSSLTRSRANISLSLLGIIDSFPKKETLDKKKVQGIKEGKFKSQLFYLLFFGKLAVFLFIWIIWDTGGLSFNGFVGTLGIVIPVFATYLSIAWDDMLKRKNQITFRNSLIVNKQTQYSGYLAFLVYYFAVFLILYLQSVGKIPNPVRGQADAQPGLDNFFALLALTESSLGVYVNKLIFSFFKKEA